MRINTMNVHPADKSGINILTLYAYTLTYIITMLFYHTIQYVYI